MFLKCVYVPNQLKWLAYRYIHRVADAITSRRFFRAHVKPMANRPPPELEHHPTLHYFKDARGAIDGSHIHAWVPEEIAARYRNRKGYLSQNVLAASDFQTKFVYVLSGWEGSAADSRIFESARSHGLSLPRGRYFLADAGFPLCDMLLTPFRGKRYHLKEWSRGNQK